MIIVRAPLRISFVGGGTDLADFYTTSCGRVISTAINKYVYVAINQTPLVEKVVARYSSFEVVKHARELKNDRLRAALLNFGVYRNIDISTFSDLSIRTGLGSSSSFSVALVKGLSTLRGKKIGPEDAAAAACYLEIECLKEPIGKQDQYAAALGGLNVFEFRPDHSVTVEPVFLDYKKRLGFENHLLLFFTGITRLASSVLTEQKEKIPTNLKTLQAMADSVLHFREELLRGNFEALGAVLHQGWLHKKTLASNISNTIIDDLYQEGLRQGAWGGKVLGAGGGGCILFITKPEHKTAIREGMKRVALLHQLEEFNEIPFSFVQSGAEIIVNHGSY